MAIGNEEAKLFVAGLPDSVSEEVLKQVFEATGGKVVSVSLPKDRMTGRPRGFGFVTMATPAEAQAARDALDGSMQGGRSISVRPFSSEPPRKGEGGPAGGPRGGFGGPGGGGGPRGPGGGGAPQAPDRTLYVGKLPYEINNQEIESLISSVVGEGQVVRIHLPMDPDGRKRGFGFVTMASSESAKTAADQLNNADFHGRRLIVNIAHPKGDRPAGGGGGGFGGGGGGGFGGGGGGGGFGGGGGGFGGGGGGGFGAPGGFGGGAPPASRKTFDSDRRRKGGGGGEGGEGGPKKGGRGGRRESRQEEDWRNADFDRDDLGRDDD